MLLGEVPEVAGRASSVVSLLPLICLEMILLEILDQGCTGETGRTEPETKDEKYIEKDLGFLTCCPCPEWFLLSPGSRNILGV